MCNISGSRTGLVFQLPNQARYQTSLSPDIQLKILPLWSNMWSRGFYHIFRKLSRAAIGGNWGETGECATFREVEPVWCSGSQTMCGVQWGSGCGVGLLRTTVDYTRFIGKSNSFFPCGCGCVFPALNLPQGVFALQICKFRL